MSNMFFLNRDTDARAVRSWIQQMVATDRENPTDRDLSRLFATSVIAYRAGKKRADAVAAVPMVIKNKAGEPLSKTDPLMMALARSYKDNMRRSELTLCFWGSTLMWKRRSYSGMPYSLRWINPNLWQLYYGVNGLRGFTVANSARAEHIPVRLIKPEDAVYMHEMDFENDFEGVSPIEVAFRHAELGVEMAETQVAFMRNRAIPASIVQPADEKTHVPNKDSRDSLVKLLREVYQGARNAGRTLIQAARWEWVQLQANFDNVKFETHYEQAAEAVSIAFDMPVSLIRESASNFAQQREVRLDWAQSWVLPRVGWYGEQCTEQLAQDAEVVKKYGTGLIVEPDPTNVALLKEDEKGKVERTNMKVQGGYKDLYSAAMDAGEKDPPESLKGKYMWGGVPTPIEQIDTLWQSKLPAPVQPNLDTSTAQPPLLPAPVVPPADLDANKDAPPTVGKAICIMIDLGNDPELIGLQNKVKERMGIAPITWNAPDSFHVTLISAPVVPDDQIALLKAAMEEISWVEDMKLPIGSVGCFDDLNRFALHFKVRRNADLEDLQQTLYDICIELGIHVGTYSSPEDYKPHITMGYAETKPPRMIYQSKIKVQPKAIQLSVDKQVVYQRAWIEGDEPEPTPPTPEPIPTVSEAIVAAKAFLPDDVFSELKVAARKGGLFVPAKLPKPTVTYIGFLKELGYENDVVLDAAKSFTLSVLAAKSVSSTQRDFEKEFDDLIYAARNDVKNRKQVSSKLRSLVNQYVRRALVDGLVDGGIEDAVLNEDDRTIVGELLGEAGRHVTQFLDVLFKGDGISDDQAVYKATQWWNKTVYPAYLAGLERAAADSLFEWRIGVVEQSCKSCLALDGQKHRYSDFKAAGFLPKNDNLLCGGFLCDCSLVPTKGRSRGRLDTVPLGAMRSVPHDHEHEDEPEGEAELV